MVRASQFGSHPSSNRSAGTSYENIISRPAYVAFRMTPVLENSLGYLLMMGCPSP